jgi:hypothetical protein
MKEADSPISPEGLYLTIWHHNTTERYQSSDYERVHQRSEDRIGGVCSNHLSYPGVKKLIKDLLAISLCHFLWDLKTYNHEED